MREKRIGGKEMSRINYICPKCGKEIIIETDVTTSEEKAKKMHKCKKNRGSK